MQYDIGFPKENTSDDKIIINDQALNLFQGVLQTDFFFFIKLSSTY